jgi:O-antigen/teichoic acid export membrane protein
MNIASTSAALPIEKPPTAHHAMDMRETLTRNVSWIILARAGYMVSRVLVPPFVVARIGLQSYGLWSALFVFISYIGFSALGVSSAYVKYVAEYVARGEIRKANSLLSTGIVATTIIGLAVFLISLLASPWILSWLNVPPAVSHEAFWLLNFIVALFVVNLSLSVFSDSLAGSQKIAETQLVSVSGYLIETALIFLLVGAGWGIKGLAIAFAIRLATGILFSAYLAFKLQPWLRLSIRRCSREALKTLLGFGGIVQLSFLMSIALNTVERAIAAPLIGLSAVGLLDLSDKLPSNAGSVSEAFSYCFMPAASYLQGKETGERGRLDSVLTLYLRGSRYMSLTAASMLGLLAAACAPIAMVWVGKLYPGMGFLLAIFTIQQQFHIMTGAGTSILKGVGKPLEDFFYIIPNIIFLALAIPASRLIVGHWSAVGLGTAVVMATILSSIVFLTRAHHRLAVPWNRYLKYVALPAVVPYLVAAICAWPAWLLMPDLGRLSGAALLFGVGLVYLVTLLVAVDRLVFDADEREMMRSVVRREARRLLHAYSFSTGGRLGQTVAPEIRP